MQTVAFWALSKSKARAWTNTLGAWLGKADALKLKYNHRPHRVRDVWISKLDAKGWSADRAPSKIERGAHYLNQWVSSWVQRDYLLIGDINASVIPKRGDRILMKRNH